MEGKKKGRIVRSSMSFKVNPIDPYNLFNDDGIINQEKFKAVFEFLRTAGERANWLQIEMKERWRVTKELEKLVKTEDENIYLREMLKLKNN